MKALRINTPPLPPAKALYQASPFYWGRGFTATASPRAISRGCPCLLLRLYPHPNTEDLSAAGCREAQSRAREMNRHDVFACVSKSLPPSARSIAPGCAVSVGPSAVKPAEHKRKEPECLSSSSPSSSGSWITSSKRVAMAAFNPTYYAHSLAGKPESEWQTLDDHLVRVAERCGAFAAVFGYRTWGYAIGLLHDVGKASDAFQQRLRHATAVVDHSTLGASIARALYSKSTQHGFPGALMAYAIAGHHGGMPNGISYSASSNRRPLESRLAELDSDASTTPTRAAIDALFSTGVLTAPRPESLELLRPLEHPTRGNAQSAKVANRLNALSLSTTARMLYSCLVDADYLDTERVMAPDVHTLRADTCTSTLPELLAMLEEHLRKLAAAPESATPVNVARRLLADDCRNAAAAEPGLFTLTAPTGSGKTKSVVLFGLMHAIRHGMQRIVFALPFTTLVEQTVDVLRDIFGADNVLEHHSTTTSKQRKKKDVSASGWRCRTGMPQSSSRPTSSSSNRSSPTRRPSVARCTTLQTVSLCLTKRRRFLTACSAQRWP